MGKLTICIVSISFFYVSGYFSVLNGQITGPERVIVKKDASYVHSLSPAGSGTSYLWEIDDADFVYQSWDSVVVNWDTDGEYSVSLSLYDSSKYSSELLDELLVTVVIPVIEYGYDAAGNRINRSIVYYSEGSKKSARIKGGIGAELEKYDQTMVYPNPSDHIIYLKLSHEFSEAGKKQYALYDNLGKLVMKGNIYSSLNEIQVSGLKNGTYYLVLTCDNNRKQWTIIKQ